MRSIWISIICTSAICLVTANVHGKVDYKIPDSSKVQIITMDDGSTLVGRIIEIGDATIVFDGPVGKSTISKSQIRQIRETDRSRIKNGKHWFANPNQSRLFLWPTGRTLKKGQGYFGDIYIFLPSVAIGITDQFTFEAGLSLFPGLGMDNQLMYAIPKLGFHAAPAVDFSVAAIIFRVPNDWDDGDAHSVGLLCGTGTFGSDDYSLSLGIGYGFADGEVADKPALMLGGEARVARRLSLMSENWILPGVDDAVVSYGCRFLGERVSVDLALFNVLDDELVFPGIPFVGFVWNF
jgi:hypothetical protein